MKKISIILFTILLLITNFSVIFADEIDENESNNPDTTEISDDTKINEIDNNIKIESINDEFKSIKKDLDLLSSSINQFESINDLSGGNGKLTNFDLLSDKQLQFLYNNYNEYYIVYFIKSVGDIYLVKKENVINESNSDNNFNTTINRVYRVNTDGVLSYSNLSNVVLLFRDNYISDESGQYGYFKYSFNNQLIYQLNIFTINVDSNGFNSYSIQPNNIPYNIGYYYPNQVLTISYDNSNNDFIGWYDSNGNLLSSNIDYTFSINSNTNLVINYFNTDLNNLSNNIIYIILLLSFIVILNLFNGGKLYD